MCVSIWVSAENWNRSRDEVAFLMTLFSGLLDTRVREAAASGIRLRFVGDLRPLPQQRRDLFDSAQRVFELCDSAERRTQHCTSLQLTFAVSYGARQDMAAAAAALARLAVSGALNPRDITPDLFQQQLSTSELTLHAGQPDLLIRTSGEQRLSNFLLYELAYTELYFCDTYWPDFGGRQLLRALHEFAKRERRFGKR